MRINSLKNGYSLVEVLVAVSILMLSIVGPMTIAVKSYQSAQYTRQQNTAFFLAQEGISIVNAIRNNGALAHYKTPSTNPWAWTTEPKLSACFLPTGCNINASNTTFTQNVSTYSTNIIDCSTISNCALKFDESTPRAIYHLSTGSGTLTPYTRIIKLKKIGADEVLVQSEVQWSSKLFGGTQTISQSTSLFNLYK